MLIHFSFFSHKCINYFYISGNVTSPERVPCPLVPGTPEVPPPRVPQRWELQTPVLDASGPSRVDLEPEELEELEGAAPPPLQTTPRRQPAKQFQPLVLTPSTGVFTVGEGVEVHESCCVGWWLGFRRAHHPLQSVAAPNCRICLQVHRRLTQDKNLRFSKTTWTTFCSGSALQV